MRRINNQVTEFESLNEAITYINNKYIGNSIKIELGDSNKYKYEKQSIKIYGALFNNFINSIDDNCMSIVDLDIDRKKQICGIAAMNKSKNIDNLAIYSDGKHLILQCNKNNRKIFKDTIEYLIMVFDKQDLPDWYYYFLNIVVNDE